MSSSGSLASTASSLRGPKERRPLTEEEVRWLQGVLRRQGLYAGEVHGVL
jgi:hypothetical protein